MPWTQLRKSWLRVFVLSATALIVFFILSSIQAPRLERRGGSIIHTWQSIAAFEIPFQRTQFSGPFYDKDELPSGKYSRIYLSNETSTFQPGDVISVQIVLYNNLNKPVSRGGHLILVWMVDPKHKASATGSVIDHVNGSYTGVLRASWSGSVTIKCAIACSREGFELMNKYFEAKGPSKKIHCIFEANKKKEYSLGSPSVPVGENFCNFTAENYGIPWFCVRPKERGVQCSDWTKVSHEVLNINFLFENKTVGSYYIRAIAHQMLREKLTIIVEKEQRPALIPSTPCKGNIAINTWSAQSPVGFFYNNTWHLNNCKLSLHKNYHQCFQNRRIILYGDSTVRQWFMYLFNSLELRFKSEAWNGTKWHRQSLAYKKDYNYYVVWAHHGLPIYFGEVNRGETRPVYVSLDEIPAGSNHIVLIHLYAHFHYNHPSAFRRNLQHIAQSVKDLLVRAPDVRVALKGPHYFSYRDRKTLGGMWGPLYDQAIKEVFYGLYDKVVFLDVWDMTVARENRDVHPASILVRSMVNLFLNYVCSQSC